MASNAGISAPGKDSVRMMDDHIQQMHLDMTRLQRDVSLVKDKLNPRVRSTEEDAFDAACRIASEDPNNAAERLCKLAQPVGNIAIVEFARLCLSGPVGHVGARRALRAVAVMLLDRVLEKDPNFAPALCAKGEALLPPAHVGRADPDVPMTVLQEAYALFERASQLGSIEGMFLKGRWLITMAPLHKSSEKAAEGKHCVKSAAEQNFARALVFLAHCYEFPARFYPVSFTKDLPSGKLAREKLILSYYMRAAQLGDADALNDVGSSYATGYGGLKYDFDTTVQFYVKAIQAGSLHAFDNLGTHYETGMSGRYKDRIDLKKAVHYYRHGARMRCSKCSHNLAQGYEEGMGEVLKRDTTHAEKYYRHTIYLADDDNDSAMAARALKDLISLYVTRIKLNNPDSEAVETSMRRMNRYLQPRMVTSTMQDVNKALIGAVRGKEKALVDILGVFNAAKLKEHAETVLDRIHRNNGQPTVSDKVLLTHLFGAYAQDAARPPPPKQKSKRRRTSE